MVASGAILAWLPCAVFGIIAYLTVRYSRHYLALPLVIFFGAVAFYAWLGFDHYSLGEAQRNGWVLGAPPEAKLRQVWNFPSLLKADWGVILSQYTSLVALLSTSIIAILLNVSALELASEEEIDLNKELRAAGVANLLGGLAGGMVGFQSLSLSSLPLRMGVRSRFVGLFSALACLFLLWFGTGLLRLHPEVHPRRHSLYTGISFLAEWIFDAYFRLIREDYFLVMLILAIVAVAGYLEGVGAGIIIATVLFVLKYSSVNVHQATRYPGTASSQLGGTGRLIEGPAPRQPGRPRIHHSPRLKGFIFFGSADNLLSMIREQQNDKSLPRLAYVVLDFKHVSGPRHLGHRQHVQAFPPGKGREGFIIILAASVPVEIQNSFRGAGLLVEGPSPIRLFRDRDFSIEWCEDEILKREMSEAQKEVRTLSQILNDFHPWQVDTSTLLGYMERLDIDKGHYLILQGDPSSELFFIEKGKVKVIVELDNGRTMRIRTMGAGTVVGEIGLYLDQQRLASVVTEEPCTIYRLSEAALHKMERENSALASAFHEFMARVLAERVTQQNRTLRALVE